MTMIEVYEEYVRYQRFQGVSLATVRDYDCKIKSVFIMNGVGNIEFEQLTVTLVMDYIIDLRDRRNIAVNTVSSYIKSIRAFLNWTYDNDYSEVNWLKKLPKYKQYKVQKEVYRDDEIMAIFASIKGNSTSAWLKRLIFALALDTGMRSSELLSLRVTDIMEHGQPYVKVTGTKGGADRTLPLSHATYQIYHAYMIKRYETVSDYLLINRNGVQLTQNSLDRYIETNVKGVGIRRGNMHYFRHTRITRWLLEGNSTMVVMMWAGHKKPETTNNYWHYSQELQLTGAKFMDIALLLSLIPKPTRMPRKKRKETV